MQHAYRLFPVPDAPFEKLVRRRDRRRRNQRVGAALVALALAVASFGLLHRAFDRTSAIPAAPRSAIWSREFGTPKGDYAGAITADASGVYVAGTTKGDFPGRATGGGSSAFVRAYDPAGRVRWTTQFGHAGSYATAITSDPYGNVYLAVAGSGAVDYGSTSITMLDARGNILWTKPFLMPSGAAGVVAYVLAMATDRSGVYLAGKTNGALPGQQAFGLMDAFVAKYSPGGAELWAHQFGSSRYNEASGIAVDATGVYVAVSGSCSGPSIQKFSLGGAPEWLRGFSKSLYGVAGGCGSGGIAASQNGVFASVNVGKHHFLRSYATDGVQQWSIEVTDSGEEIAADAAGEYVAQAIPVPGGSLDYELYVQKYDPYGRPLFRVLVGRVSTVPSIPPASNEFVDVGGIIAGPSGVYLCGGLGLHEALPGRSALGAGDAYIARVG